MDLMKLQNLLNECIMIEQGNYLGGNFSVDLAEAQAELDQAKQLLIHIVSQQRELLELVTEIANSKQDYSNTRHKLWAKKLISSNCG